MLPSVQVVMLPHFAFADLCPSTDLTYQEVWSHHRSNSAFLPVKCVGLSAAVLEDPAPFCSPTTVT